MKKTIVLIALGLLGLKYLADKIDRIGQNMCYRIEDGYEDDWEGGPR